MWLRTMINLFSGQKPALAHPAQARDTSRISSQHDEVLLSQIEQELCQGTLTYAYDLSPPNEPRTQHVPVTGNHSDGSPQSHSSIQRPTVNRSSTYHSRSLEHILLPPPPSQTSRQTSPTRGSVFDSEKAQRRASKLTSWFQGDSQPTKLGIIGVTDQERPQHRQDPDTLESPSADAHHQRSRSIVTSTKPAMASRFSFFSSKTTLPKSPPLHGVEEWVSAEPSKVLFPGGPPDSFSPAAFKSLQQKAEGLVSRLQAATIALQESSAEKETLAEEQQGAEFRAEQFKIQLDNIATKLAEQDEAMMNLVDELAKEKMARQEEKDQHRRSLKMIERRGKDQKASSGRISWANTVSDGGFESEDDSSAESIFSQRNNMHSPTMSMSSVSTNSPDMQQEFDFGSALPVQVVRLRMPHHPASAKGQPVVAVGAHPNNKKCGTCGEVRSSEAWTAYQGLHEENADLRHRVAELEGALDGCLDVVGRLGG